MANGIDVDLTIRDNKTGIYYRMPVLPPTIAYSEGDALADTIKILNLGNVDFLNGVDLDSMEWACFFPARYDEGYCQFMPHRTPLEYKDIFTSWKAKGTQLQLICAAAGINKAMTLRSFKPELKGFEGDIYYSVVFKEDKKVRPKQIPVTVSSGGTIKRTAVRTLASRAAVPAKPAANTYTVKAGDTLSLIAKKLGVSSWKTIYEKNKAVIGANPNSINPGQVYKI